MKMRFRRASSPSRPSAKSTPARSRTWLSGTEAMCSSRLIAHLLRTAADVIRADDAPEQQHRGELDAEHVRTEERHADFHGTRGERAGVRGARSDARSAGPEKVRHFGDQDRRE